jgi:hypothetical protein
MATRSIIAPVSRGHAHRALHQARRDRSSRNRPRPVRGKRRTKKHTAITITPRDLDLLEALACRVRIFTFEQILTLWWPEAPSPRTPRRRLELLARSGWILRHMINAYLPPDTLTPLFTWEPGAQGPDAVRIASELCARTFGPARPTQVYVPSAKTACLLGSSSYRLPPPERCQHELRLAAVYIHYRRVLPSLAGRWSGRQALPKAQRPLKDPDAVVHGDRGQIIRVIHSAGRWSPTQVEQFHRHWQSLRVSYELW